MNEKQEKEIREEIERQVLEAEKMKKRKQEAEFYQDALDDVTLLTKEEVDKIAEGVFRDFAEQQKSSRTFWRKMVVVGVVILAILAFTAVTKHNAIVRLDEQVNTKWSQVENVYQRRYDLVPNLVKTVQAYVEHEKEIFQMIADARAKAGGTLNASGNALRDPATFQQFQESQTELSQALERLLTFTEDNPEVKGDQNFLALQAQLEGSENRITVERKRFNEAVQEYNSYIKQFPQALISGLLGFREHSYFEAVAGVENAPAVNVQ